MSVNARRTTDLEPGEYVGLLQMSDQRPAKLGDYDGASLIYVADEHYVVLTCDEHDEHAGHRAYARLFPDGWECFAQASSADGWSAFHYGPEA